MKIQGSVNPSSLFSKLKPGSKSQQQLNWVFSSGLRISTVVGVLGAVGIIFVTKDKEFRELIGTLLYSDKAVTSSSSWTVPGLENLGNNCFLNVILQALSSCSIFRKYLGEIVEDYEILSVEEGDGSMPLVNSLTSLVEELATARHRRTVLSPRKVMLAMDHYIPDFNLTKQQDAEETFSHLLFLLREELSEHYVPEKSSLADVLSLTSSRILITKGREEESEWQRWRHSFHGPFNGILGSILICQSCSFQISLDFQLFHSLYLSPPIGSNGAVLAGCTLEDCLKQFFVAECLEDYCCSHCWHSAAIKYVSELADDKTDIEKLQRCNKIDSCDCKTLSSLEAFSWSNRSSCTFKQMSLAQSPKILCIHLQRASYNMFGQSVKLLGHLSFPLILDLSSFINREVGIRKMEEKSRFVPSNEKFRWTLPYSKYQNMQRDPEMLNHKAYTVEGVISEKDDHKKTVASVQNGSCENASEEGPILLRNTRYKEDKAGLILPSPLIIRQKYRLVSVVEHFGSGGGGHYTVYRKVTAKIGDEDPVALLESSIEQWYSISDSQVQCVSEKEVLDANASMLFYEKINEPRT